MTRSRSDNPTTAMVNNATLRYWYTGHGWTGMLRFIGGARKQLWASSEEAMTEDQQDPAARRREQWRAASARRRAKRKDEGLPAESGPSGGTATNAERQRRYRERKKKVDDGEE